eukprot:Sspe_Gene.26294::Locus_10830_Transcript_1_1_Confidence_1.000_Length_2248::g.26294::m.26294
MGCTVSPSLIFGAAGVGMLVLFVGGGVLLVTESKGCVAISRPAQLVADSNMLAKRLRDEARVVRDAALGLAAMLEGASGEGEEVPSSVIKAHSAWYCEKHDKHIDSVGVRGWMGDHDPSYYVINAVYRLHGGCVHALYTANDTQCVEPFPCVTVTPVGNQSTSHPSHLSDSEGLHDFLRMSGVVGRRGVWDAAFGESPWPSLRYVAMLPLPFPSDFTAAPFATVAHDLWHRVVHETPLHDASAVVVLDGQVLAGYLTEGCNGTCTLGDMGSAVQGVVEALAGAPPGESNMVGGHWAIKQHVIPSIGLTLLAFGPAVTCGTSQHTLIVIVAQAAAVLAVGFCVFAVGRGLVQPQLQAMHGAVRHLEVLDLDSAESTLRTALASPVQVKELRSLGFGLLHGVEALREYKAFIPRTLWGTDAMDGDTSSDDPSRSSKSPRTVSTRESGISEPVKRFSSNDILRDAKKISLRCALSSSRAVLMVVRFPFPGSTLSTDYLASNIELLEDLASKHNGVAHSIYSLDCCELAVSWNTSRRCTIAPKRVVGAAAYLHNSCSSIAVSLTEMTTRHGNIGTATMRGFVLIPKDASFRYYSLCATSLLSAVGSSVIVVNKELADSVSSAFRVILLGAMVSSGPTLERVYVLGEEKTEQNEEWMYCLNQQDFDGISSAVEAVLTGGDSPRRATRELAVSAPYLSPVESLLLSKLSASRDLSNFVYDFTAKPCPFSP